MSVNAPQKIHGIDLNGVLVCEEMDDFECVCDDTEGQKLFAIVAALHHHAIHGPDDACKHSACGLPSGRYAPVDQSLNDRHLCLLELLLCVTSRGVW